MGDHIANLMLYKVIYTLITFLKLVYASVDVSKVVLTVCFKLIN